jgi:hypothetical protein
MADPSTRRRVVLGAKIASYGLVEQEPDAAAAVYTES